MNLTIPAVHAQVTRDALQAGKHVWSEKPLATSLAESAELVQLAAERGLRLGCAPDTMLGPVLQQALRAFANQAVTPLRGRADFGYWGPDAWHPNPAFLFAKGAGPVLDVGPYYLTALVLALGPVTRVRAVGQTPQTERVVAEPEQHDAAAGGFGRGVGVVDMVRSLGDGTPHRMSGELAHHVLEVMLAIESAALSGESVELVSRAPRVELLPEGWDPTR